MGTRFDEPLLCGLTSSKEQSGKIVCHVLLSSNGTSQRCGTGFHDSSVAFPTSMKQYIRVGTVATFSDSVLHCFDSALHPLDQGEHQIPDLLVLLETVSR